MFRSAALVFFLLCMGCMAKAEFLPTSCGIIGSAHTSKGESFPVSCSGFMKDEKTIITAHHCFGAETSLGITRVDAKIIACGFRSEVATDDDYKNGICPFDDKLKECLVKYFKFAAILRDSDYNVEHLNLVRLNDFLAKNNVRYGLDQASLDTYYGILFTVDLSVIHINWPLERLHAEVNYPLPVKIDMNPTASHYTKCRAEGFGTGDNQFKTAFLPKIRKLNFSDIQFREPIYEPLDEPLQPLKTQLGQFFGKIQEYFPIDMLAGDSGGPLYCTDDDKTANLVGIVSGASETKGYARFSSFMYPEVKDLLK